MAKKQNTKKDDELLNNEDDFNENELEDEDESISSSKKNSKKSKDKDSDSSILDTIAEIKSRFGDESIMKLGEKPKLNVDVVSTGSIGLDAALGVGGLPKGRIVEIFGPESSGKTTLALHVIAESQKKGGVCAYIDAEHAMDPDYAKKLGVNINNLLISQPDAGEQALEITESLVRKGERCCGFRRH
jgi:recombination protein RecA